MKYYNTEDQWSDSEAYIRSKRGQREIAQFFYKLQNDEGLSDDEILDDVIEEICNRNNGDLFDLHEIYIDLKKTPITDDLRIDTRHQVGRLIAKAKKKPKQRLQKRQVRFYMWFSLAKKIREARDEPTGPTKD